MTLPDSPTSPSAPAAPPPAAPSQHLQLPEAFARDAIIAWFRGEFAAANAIIDALCSHLTQIDGGGSDYQSVFAAIHRRRLNWIPVLHMQKYFSISGVAMELRRVAANKRREEEEYEERMRAEIPSDLHHAVKDSTGDSSGDSSSSDQKIPNGGEPQEEQFSPENIQICYDHEDCKRRPELIKISKGFVAKELVKGHMVNVVKGLKLYEDIFTDLELSKLVDFISELRLSGRKGELSGETFMFFNKELKGNKREIIQMGVPIFGPIREDMMTSIEPIPPVLQAVIDHLVQWHLIPESRKPNSCLISFFDEGDYSQPYLKPPHLEQPVSTLVLSESTMAFGRILVSDQDGNYKGPLMLSLKEGSLLVMRGNSAEMARHVMCPSPNKRISITLSKVRPTTNQTQPSAIPTMPKAMTLWQPGGQQPCKVPIPGGPMSYDNMDVVPKWGLLRAPVVMITTPQPIVMGPKKIARGGTGVFLPWTVTSKRTTKHLPPRIRGRLPALPPSNEIQVMNPSAELEVSS